jgi:hypothetical protein
MKLDANSALSLEGRRQLFPRRPQRTVRRPRPPKQQRSASGPPTTGWPSRMTSSSACLIGLTPPGVPPSHQQ